jgi:hypothetical protein
VNSLLEAFLAYAGIAAPAYVAGMGLMSTLLKRAKASGADVDARLVRGYTLVSKLEQRRRTLLPELVRQDDRTKAARRQQFIATKRETDLRASANAILRVIGEDTASVADARRPSIKYRAVLVNRHAQRAHTEGKEHPFLSAGWAHAQLCDAWAINVKEAQAAIEKRFPSSLGFFVVSIAEGGDDDEDAIAALGAANA